MDISLALGGGGVKTNAHLGVLRTLEKAGHRIRAIAGTSAGGIIGAVYAGGYSSDEILARFSRIDQNHLFGRKPQDGPSLMGLEGIEALLEEMLGARTFADLRLPFAVTAVDLDHGREVTLRRGRVVEALMATIAIPGVFPPKRWEHLRLVDGGVLNPVPVTLARALAPRLPVVAVVLSSPHISPESGLIWEPNLPGPVIDRIARLRVAQAFNIFVRSVDIGNRRLTEMRLAQEKPEVVIRPEVNHIGTLDHVEVAELVGLGEAAAQEALPRLAEAAGWWSRLARLLPNGQNAPVEAPFVA